MYTHTKQSLNLIAIIVLEYSIYVCERLYAHSVNLWYISFWINGLFGGGNRVNKLHFFTTASHPKNTQWKFSLLNFVCANV